MAKFLIFCTFLLSFLSGAFATMGPSVSTYHGRIIQPNSLPLESNSVTFNLQIISPGPEECVLYEESHTKDMSGSEGLFSLNVGQGLVSLTDPGIGLSPSISNNDVFDVGTYPALTCAIGTSYTPGTGDTRKFRVTFSYAGSGGDIAISPDITINSVPYTMYASRLEGLGKDDLLQVRSGGTDMLNQANLEAAFTTTNYPLLISAIDGTHTAYAKSADLPVSGGVLNLSGGGVRVQDNPATSDAAVNQNYTDAHVGGLDIQPNLSTTLNASNGDGFVMVWDETTETFVAQAAPADSTKLPLAGGTMTGAINMDGQNLLATGHITMSPQTTINLGTYTDGQETTLIGGFGPIDAGKTWYNSTSGTMKYWDGTGVVLAGTDNTKLPLAGGTMTGAINMDGQNLLATGHITMSPQTTINLGNYTNAQQTTLVGTLGLIDKGKTWFNSDTNLMMVWDGTAAVTSGVQIGTSAGTAMGADAVPNCTSAQKLSMSLGPTFVWSCVTENGDIEGVTAGDGLGGGGTTGTPTLNVNVDDTTIEINTDTLRVKDDGITSAKIAADTIVAGDIATGAVTTAEILDGTVALIDMSANSVDSSKIVNGSIALADMGANSVNSANIVADSIVAADIAPDAVGASELADNSVASANIIDGTIATADIGNSQVTDAKISGVGVDKITSGAGRYLTYAPNNVVCTNNQVLKWVTANSRWECGTDNDVADHGGLSGLADDDHTQYALLAGRAGGQALSGGTAANNNLTLDSTSNATKGYIILNPTGGDVGIGDATPETKLDVAGTIKIEDGGETCTAPADAGMITYNGGNLEFCNGTAWQTVSAGTGAGDITAVNTNTGSGLSGGATSGDATLQVVVDDSTVEIATNTIRVKDDGITSAKIAADTIVAGDIATGAVTTTEILDGTVALIDMSANSVDSSKIVNGSIALADMGANSVNSANIVADSIVAADIATGAVTTAEILDGTVGSIDLASNSVTTAKITDLNITTGKLANNAVTDAKINDVGVDKITSGAGKYFTYLPNNSACSDGQILSWDNTNSRWVCANDGGLTDHGALGGLTDDDHTQYALLAGRAGGQTLIGGTAANNNLTLDSTSSVTKGDIILNPTSGNVGIGTSSADNTLHVAGAVKIRNSLGGVLIDSVDSEAANGNIRNSILMSRNDDLEWDSVNDLWKKSTGSVNSFAGLIQEASKLSFIVGPDDDLSAGVTNSTFRASYERLTIDTNGKVGIGDPSPETKLDVAGTIKIEDGGETCTVGDDAGMIKYDTGSIYMCNGVAWQALGVAGAGDNLGNHTATTNLNMATNSILGGTASGNDLILESTSHATKGDIILNATSGNVGIGTASPSAALEVNGAQSTVTTGTSNRGYFDQVVNPASASSADYQGIYSYTRTTSGNTQNFTGALTGLNGDVNHQGSGTMSSLRGVFGSASHGGTNTVSTSYGGRFQARNNSTGTITAAHGVRGVVNNVSTGTITTAVGGQFDIDNPGGTITTGYGVHIQAIEATNKWSLYAEDATAPSYFAGSVGVGEDSPDTKLHVTGTIKIEDGGETCSAAGDAGMITYNSGNLEFCNGSAWQTLGVSGGGDNLGNHIATTNIRLGSHYLSGDGGSEGIFVNADGGVKLGTASTVGADNLLEIVGDGDDKDAALLSYSSSSTSSAGDWGIYRARGTEASPLIVANNDKLGGFRAFGHDGAGFHDVASIDMVVDGTPGNNDLPTRIHFRTTPDGANGDQIRMTIKNDGKVGIGDTTPETLFDVEGSIQIGDGGETCGATFVGAMRYNSSTMQFCNGTSWLTLGSTGAGDNLGNHTATTNIQLGSNWISNDGDNEGIRIDTSGNVGIGAGGDPDKDLEVIRNGSGNSAIGVGATGTGDARLTLDASNGDFTGLDYFELSQFNDLSARINLSANADLHIMTNNTERLRIKNDGDVGIGDTTPDAHLEVSAGGTTGGSIFMASSNHGNDGDIFNIYEDGRVTIGQYGPNSSFRVDGGTMLGADDRVADFNAVVTSNSKTIYGSVSRLYVNPSAVSTEAYVGVRGKPINASSNTNLTNAKFVGVSGTPRTQGTSTIGELRGIQSYPQVSGTSTVTDVYGMYIRNPLKDGGSSVTTNYALYIEDQTVGATNYSIYSNSTADSYIAGNVGIGTTAPSSKLHVVDVTTSGDVEVAHFEGGADADNTAAVVRIGHANDRGLYLKGGRRIGDISFAELGIIDTDGTFENPSITFDDVGNVGIGTTAPAAKLHVDGSGAGGGLCVTSDNTCGAVPTGGEISAETTLNTGADYAEYFEAEENLLKGDLVGLNTTSGKVRGYQPGDQLLGVVSTDPGVIGNSELRNSKTAVLVALVGQVPVLEDRVKEEAGIVFTKDGETLGYRLSNGNVFLNLSTGAESLKRKIAAQDSKIAAQDSKIVAQGIEINSLKESKKSQDNKFNELKLRLEKLEKILQK